MIPTSILYLIYFTFFCVTLLLLILCSYHLFEKIKKCYNKEEQKDQNNQKELTQSLIN